MTFILGAMDLLVGFRIHVYNTDIFKKKKMSFTDPVYDEPGVRKSRRKLSKNNLILPRVLKSAD